MKRLDRQLPHPHPGVHIFGKMLYRTHYIYLSFHNIYTSSGNIKGSNITSMLKQAIHERYKI